MGEFTVEKSIEFEASLNQLWDDLLKVKEWPKWKPFIQAASIKGGYEAITNGSKFTMNVKIGGPAALPLTCTVNAFDRPKKLGWEGGVKGLFHADHSFEFEEVGTKVRVTTRETFSGILTGLVGLMVPRSDLEKLHEDWLAAIKRHATGETEAPAEPVHH